MKQKRKLRHTIYIGFIIQRPDITYYMSFAWHYKIFIIFFFFLYCVFLSLAFCFVEIFLHVELKSYTRSTIICTSRYALCSYETIRLPHMIARSTWTAIIILQKKKNCLMSWLYIVLSCLINQDNVWLYITLKNERYVILSVLFVLLVYYYYQVCHIIIIRIFATDLPI